MIFKINKLLTREWKLSYGIFFKLHRISLLHLSLNLISAEGCYAVYYDR